MEAHTITCSHCCRVFLFNPDRQREREWCWTCDHYICDGCAAVKAVVGCKTFRQLMDEQDAKDKLLAGRR